MAGGGPQSCESDTCHQSDCLVLLSVFGSHGDLPKQSAFHVPKEENSDGLARMDENCFFINQLCVIGQEGRRNTLLLQFTLPLSDRIDRLSDLIDE